MLHPRVPAPAAFWAMVLGLVLIAVKYFVPGVGAVVDRAFTYNFHFLGAVFATLVVFMLAWAKAAPRATPWRLETQTPIDMTPWAGAPWASLALVAIVIAIYASFASFAPEQPMEAAALVTTNAE
jgi:uncharacterized sodium:solute symporter family permease YidK